MNDLGLRGQVDVHDVEPKADDGLETKLKLFIVKQTQLLVFSPVFF